MKKEEEKNESLEYFGGDELAANVFLSKYALKKDGENFEKTPIEMHRRMAKEFARIENNYSEQENSINLYENSNLSEYGQKRESLTEDKIFEYSPLSLERLTVNSGFEILIFLI